ncbi:MAG: pseudouridine synthase, partial [Bacteroidales bacterium]|nr:pseudouridine synthase [Bacteroidales bacterium]
EDGENRGYSRRSSSENGEKRGYSRRSSSEDGEKRGYSRRSSEDGEKRGYSRRSSSEDGEKRGYSRRPSSEDGEKRGYSRRSSEDGENRGYSRRSSSEDGENRGYSRRSSEDGENRGYSRRSSSEDGEKRGYSRRSSEDGEKRGYSRKKDYEGKSDDNRRSKRSFSDKDGFRADKPQRERKSGSSRKQSSEDDTIRLNKFIADAGVCSRREADTLITSGSVKVNGVIVDTLGSKVKKSDKVQIGDETLHNERLRYLLLNKPKGYITTMSDPQKRNTVLQLIDGACKERIFPVGRLDRNTSGLLIFTNDGELANKLMHPSSKVAKVYHVELDKPLTKNDMTAISEGIELEDGLIAADDIAYSSPDSKKEVGIEIHSGKNQVVRRIFQHLGYEVVKLDRSFLAGLTKKNLPRGEWRFLTEKEVAFLKML